jgi:hypothetical protein
VTAHYALHALHACTAELAFVDIKAARKWASPRRLGAALWTFGPPRAPAGRTSLMAFDVSEVSGGGASGSGRRALPHTVDPGEPSRPTPGPPALVSTLPAPCLVATPAPARSPEGGSTAYGRDRSGQKSLVG